ncbi:hypothetical protein FRX31_016208, partial [Thalictrum thalictroides]
MDQNDVLENSIYQRNMIGFLSLCVITYIMGFVFGILGSSNLNIVFRVFLCCASILPLCVYCLSYIKTGNMRLANPYRLGFFIINFIQFNLLFFAGVKYVQPLVVPSHTGHRHWNNTTVTLGWFALIIAGIAL